MTNRAGLYIIVGLTLLVVCDNNYKITEIERKVEKISNIPLQTKNVIGEDTPDKFYEINGIKSYTEIDGKSIETYFQK